MVFRCLVGVMGTGALLGCQAVLGLDEGKPRDVGQGGAAASTSAGAGGASSAASSGAAGGDAGGCAPLCKLGQACQSGTDCESGACVSDACATAPRLLLLATHKITTPSEKLVLAASTDDSRAWKLDTLVGRSVSPPSVVITPEGKGVGLLRFTDINAPLQDNGIMFSAWSATGGWRSFEFIGKPVLTTFFDPALAASEMAETVHATFLNSKDSSQNYMAFDGAAWSAPEPLSSVLLSNNAAGITANGDEAAFVFAEMSEQLYAQDKPGGSFSAIAGKTQFPPAIVKLRPASSGDMTDRMVVFVDTSGLSYTTRSAAQWSAPQPITGAEPDVTDMEKHRLLALAALPDGAAALGYRGADGKLHVMRYTPGQPTPWSPLLPSASLDVAIDSPPSMVRGLTGDELELAYVSASHVFHTSYAGALKDTWSAPAQVDTDGAYLYVAIASATAP